jgi:hypothetical protein
MADKFFIAPYKSNSGLQLNQKPWLIPDEAFSELTNMYVYEGRVRKKYGTQWLGNDPLSSRLRVSLGDTNGGGDLATTTPLNNIGNQIINPRIGQIFTVGDDIFTLTTLNPGINDLLSTNPAATATFNITTGDVVIDDSQPDETVFYYPALPVMGLLGYDTAVTQTELTIAFDTRFSYLWNSITMGWDRITGENTPDTSFWTGDNSQFFWGDTWFGDSAANRLFFVTNFNENEVQFLRYFDGANWFSFRPELDGIPNYLNSCLILIVFKNRLLALNTWEGPGLVGTNYQNRVRYSSKFDPTAADAWRMDIPGKGGGLDAATTEAIITVEFIKDRLIVYFERSTWELVYQGNDVQPFTWQKINTELGAESTFSVVPFDKIALGVGNTGIHACNGANVERIDDLIKDEVWKIKTDDNGINRVYGIRDFYTEVVYWTFPEDDLSDDYPYQDRVLVYNYKTGTWAYFIDSITCFGYFQDLNSVMWSSEDITWAEDEPWSSGQLQNKFQQVIAGNQQGFTLLINRDKVENDTSLYITEIVNVYANNNNQMTLTVIDHNLTPDAYILFSGIVSTDTLDFINHLAFKVDTVVDSNTIIINYVDDSGDELEGDYLGGGYITILDNVVITTKEYNFYADKGMNAYISKVDFLVDATSKGSLQVQNYVSTSLNNNLEDAVLTGINWGTGNLDTYPYIPANGVTPGYPYEATATRVWRSIYFQTEGEVIQFRITMSPEQMTTIVNTAGGLDGPALDKFVLNVMVITAEPTSRLQ